MLERIEGFVIKAQDYQETNKIITIYSAKIGKFSAIARGAKKAKSRMAAITQPFILGEFYVYLNKGLSTIQQGDIIDSFRLIREDIIKTAYAAYIAELTDKLIDSQIPDSFLYNQFYQTICWISNHKDVEVPIFMYEMKLFDKGGFSPVVEECVHCSKKNNLHTFSIKEGGLLCPICQHYDTEAIRIPAVIARLLHIFKQVGLERVGTISMKEENKLLLRKLLDAYYDAYGGYYLKSKRFLQQMDSLQ